MFQGPTELLRIVCFDRISFDPKIQIRYFDSTPIADILTKENFTRDDWNNHFDLATDMLFGRLQHLEASETEDQEVWTPSVSSPCLARRFFV